MSREKFSEFLADFQRKREAMVEEVGKVIIGQRSVLDLILASIFSRGHCLLVGVPGLAKTLTVSSLARVMALTFKRIQFTPDLMPSDITGTNIIDEDEHGRRQFRFVTGPLFAHIVLADEINRTPPKTQAALLEAMQERQVTVAQESYPLPNPFFVIATQNPIEQEGTYPLPEAQLDRFMFNIQVDYPTKEEEEQILSFTTGGGAPDIKAIMTAKDIVNMQTLSEKIAISKYLIEYTANLVRATRPKQPEAPDFVKELVDWGAGPRAGQFLIRGAKALAAMDGRFNVAAQDIRDVAVPVFRHRIATNFQAQAEGIDSVEVVARLLATVQEPDVEKYERAQTAVVQPDPKEA